MRMGRSPVDPSVRSAEAGLPVDQGPRPARCYRAGSCESITAAQRRAGRQRDAAAPKATLSHRAEPFGAPWAGLACADRLGLAISRMETCMNRFVTVLAAFAAGLALILPLASQAQTPSQNWPQRNVRFILP